MTKPNELFHLAKKIQEKREYLDEMIAQFNRDNSSVDEMLIKKHSKELERLITEKEWLENIKTNNLNTKSI